MTFLARQQDYGHPMTFSFENKTHRRIKYLIISNNYQIQYGKTIDWWKIVFN